MDLPPVPAPNLTPPYDIAVYLKPKSVTLIFGTSLQGTRSVKEFLDLLKAAIISPDDFHLQTLQDREVVDLEGTILPGEYIVVGGPQEYLPRPLMTFRKEAALLRGTPFGKKRELSTTDSPEGGRSQRDSSKESARFKSRLIARDKGCVVCMAQYQDDDSMYLYEVDSEMFIGAHIFPLQYYTAGTGPFPNARNQREMLLKYSVS